MTGKKATEAYSCRLLFDAFQPIGVSSHNVTPDRRYRFLLRNNWGV